jgi:hypothetical protein
LRAGYATVDGFPSYVRGWCCMAKSGSMQRGYRDVGYLLAIRVAEFRPVQFNARLWRRLVMELSGHVRRNEKAAVGAWFKEHYPALMHLIPDRRHREFVAGFIERTREEFELTGEEHVDPVAS